MERKIRMSSLVGSPRHDRLKAWIAANEVDLNNVAAASNAVVFPELDLIAFTVFSRDEKGLCIVDTEQNDTCVKETQLVPMLSTPEYHNL